MLGSSFDALTRRASSFSGTPNRTGAAIGRAQMEPFVPDAEIAITAAPKTVQILSGAPTTVWSYEGQLLSGSGVTVQNIPGIYLGPILRAQSGKKVRIFFHNNLAEDSVIHPHGLRVPEDCDGVKPSGQARPRSMNSR
jgi:FtsP/CotA-like multicopper oxidase with cupredoxin domain